MLARLAPVILLLLCGCAAGPAPRPDALPAVAIRTLSGEPGELSAQLRGQVGLISLWATWCEPCLAEFPALQRFAEATRGKGVRAIAVAIGEPRDQVAAFVARHDLRYEHWVDEGYALADALGQRRVPATIIVDAAGRVRHSGGAFDEAALSVLRQLLSP